MGPSKWTICFFVLTCKIMIDCSNKSNKQTSTLSYAYFDIIYFKWYVSVTLRTRKNDTFLSLSSVILTVKEIIPLHSLKCYLKIQYKNAKIENVITTHNFLLYLLKLRSSIEKRRMLSSIIIILPSSISFVYIYTHTLILHIRVHFSTYDTRIMRTIAQFHCFIAGCWSDNERFIGVKVRGLSQL